jgi:UDP-N-acetyl-D-mannosaminuronic acid dehydrogenase
MPRSSGGGEQLQASVCFRRFKLKRRMSMTTKIAVIGMGYVGIPAAALLADAPGFDVTGIQRRSRRSGWKIDVLNSGRCPFEGDEPGLDDLIRRVVEKGTFRVTDDYSVIREMEIVLLDSMKRKSFGKKQE